MVRIGRARGRDGESESASCGAVICGHLLVLGSKSLAVEV